MMRPIRPLICALVLLASSQFAAEIQETTCIAVVDGDTIRVGDPARCLPCLPLPSP